MKETSKRLIDSLCLSFVTSYCLVSFVENIEWVDVLLAIGMAIFTYAAFMFFMAADIERRWRRKRSDAGTHDYYGNKIEEEDGKE